MRLLHTKKLTFEEFVGQNIPRYAILSHRWVEGEEVSFYEWNHLTEKTTEKSGYRKIWSAADLAHKEGYDWVWVDTCCIDKSSSAELQESINSMYKWYENAGICYAYLNDVSYSDTLWSEFENSRWFTRGWTLQELVAPNKLSFFSKNWRQLGKRGALASFVSRITGIPIDALTGRIETQYYSVAIRMSWASQRETTRIEDRAYSLFGLFKVNLPLLYGEGENAFRRLQEEILSTQYDHSLFAWTLDPTTKRPETYYTGLLAPSPQDFQSCGDIHEAGHHLPKPYSKTNLGLSISFSLTPVKNTVEADLFLGALNCTRGAKVGRRFVAIFLKKLMEGMYARVDPTMLADVPTSEYLDKERDLFVPHDIDKCLRLYNTEENTDASRICSLYISLPGDSKNGPSIQVEPSSLIVKTLPMERTFDISLKDYQPNEPIGAFRIASVNEDQFSTSLAVAFGYSVSHRGQKEIWLAEIPFWETDWRYFQRALKRTSLSKQYPGRFSIAKCLSSSTKWNFVGRLGLYVNGQLSYRLWINVDG